MAEGGSWWSPAASQSLDLQPGRRCRDGLQGGEATLGQEPEILYEELETVKNLELHKQRRLKKT